MGLSFDELDILNHSLVWGPCNYYVHVYGCIGILKGIKDYANEPSISNPKLPKPHDSPFAAEATGVRLAGERCRLEHPSAAGLSRSSGAVACSIRVYRGYGGHGVYGASRRYRVCRMYKFYRL